jgi:hypothetical protein
MLIARFWCAWTARATTSCRINSSRSESHQASRSEGARVLVPRSAARCRRARLPFLVPRLDGRAPEVSKYVVDYPLGSSTNFAGAEPRSVQGRRAGRPPLWGPNWEPVETARVRTGIARPFPLSQERTEFFCAVGDFAASALSGAEPVETLLLLVAERAIKLFERGLHGLHRAQHRVEPLLHRLQTADRRERPISGAIRVQQIDRFGRGVLQFLEGAALRPIGLRSAVLLSGSSTPHPLGPQSGGGGNGTGERKRSFVRGALEDFACS